MEHVQVAVVGRYSPGKQSQASKSIEVNIAEKFIAF
jgi:hypothetical protein